MAKQWEGWGASRQHGSPPAYAPALYSLGMRLDEDSVQVVIFEQVLEQEVGLLTCVKSCISGSKQARAGSFMDGSTSATC